MACLFVSGWCAGSEVRGCRAWDAASGRCVLLLPLPFSRVGLAMLG